MDNLPWNGSCEDWLHGDEHLIDIDDSDTDNSEQPECVDPGEYVPPCERI